MSEAIIACPVCGLTQHLAPLPNGAVAECCRCGTTIAKAQRNSLSRTAAFTIAALLLYVPANIYPIMRMEFQGVFSESTVWDGCARLFHDGQWLVAVIIFLASLLVPLLKLLGLFWLVVSAKFKSKRAQLARTRVYRLIEIMGPWAMLDVFLLAILVAVVKLGRFATVTPGPGLLAFASVVVLTICASMVFDPREIWVESDTTHENSSTQD